MARFLHLSDLHAVRPGTLASGVLDTGTLLQNAIDRLLERRCALGALDAVIISGDISDDGSSESYDVARAQLDRLELPMLCVPGNHDSREALRRAFADQPGIPVHGLIDWSIDIAETRIIGLDTLIEGQGGGTLRPESLSHLARSLETAGERSVVIVLHHPPLQIGIRFMDAIGLSNPEELAGILEQAAPLPGRLQIIAGHVHGVYVGALAGMPVMTAPSICSAFALDIRTDAPVGFRTAPTGCAVLNTGPEGIWSVIPIIDQGSGIFPF